MNRSGFAAVVLAALAALAACDASKVASPEVDLWPQFTTDEPMGSLAEAEALALQLEGEGIDGHTIAFLGRPSEFPTLVSYVESETVARTFPFVPHIEHTVSVNIIRNSQPESWTRIMTPTLGVSWPAFRSTIPIDIDCALMISDTRISAWTQHHARYNLPYIIPSNPIQIRFLQVVPSAPVSDDHDECRIVAPPPPPPNGGGGDPEDACWLVITIDWYDANGNYVGSTEEWLPVAQHMCEPE